MMKVEIRIQKRDMVFLQPGRVAQSDSRSTGLAHLSVKKNFLLRLIQVEQLSVACGKNGAEYWLTA